MSIKRGVAISFGKTGAGFLISFASNIVLARLLLPSEIGIFSTALAVLAILHAIRDFGLGRYLLKEPILTDDKIRTVFGVAILISWSLGAIIFVFRGQAAEFYRERQIAEILGWLSVNFLFLPFGQPSLALMRRERRYGRLSVITVLSSLFAAIVSITAALFGSGPLALAYGAIAHTCTTVALCLASRPDHLLMLPSLKEWRSVLQFGSVGSGTTLINEFGAQAPELLLGRLLGFSAVGLYSRALGISAIIQRVFAQAVAWVMGPEFAAVFRTGKAPVASVLLVTDFLIAVGWPALVFLAFKADAIILFLYGENWLPAAPLVPALCAYQAIRLVASQSGALYEGSGDVNLQMRNALILQFVSIALLVLGSMHSLLAVVWLRALYGVIELIVQASVYRRHVEIGLRALLATCRRSLVVTGGVAAMLAAMIALEQYYGLGGPGVLALEAAMVAVTYLALLHFVGHPLAEQMRIMARRVAFPGFRGKKA